MHLSIYSTNVELSTYSILKLAIKAPPQTPRHKVISASSGFYYAFFFSLTLRGFIVSITQLRASQVAQW